ncbi:hypothetical protein G9A89_001577 [Geosiphon pyriformis]|nr:hypothetical protein G9A89_001577 [Geosiphon pyriformis]
MVEYLTFSENELKPPPKRPARYNPSPKPVFPLPHKKKLTYKEEIDFIRRMAQYANFPYCFPEHNEIGKVILDQNVVADAFQKTLEDIIIIVYFRGPRYTRDEWKKRPIDLFPIEMDKNLPQRPLVDSVWHQHVQEMIPSLSHKIERFWRNKKSKFAWSVYFVGHGIGGAYAILAATYIRASMLQEFQMDVSKISVITFGAPRVGDFYFVRFLKRTFNYHGFIRVTHSNDWIPRDFMAKGTFLHYYREYWIENQECNCNLSVLKDVIYNCSGRTSLLDFDENNECNLGTVDSLEDKEHDVHLGPYLGITMGNCEGFALNKEVALKDAYFLSQEGLASFSLFSANKLQASRSAE